MKLKKIKITNFKGIANADISPSGRMNLIIGDNGAGKTSYIKAVAIWLSWLLARIESLKKNGQLVDKDDIRNGYSSAEIYGQIDDAHNTSWTVRCFRNKTKDDKSDYSSLNRLVDGLENGDGVNIPLAVYYPVSRSVLEIPLRTRNHKFNNLSAYEEALSDKKGVDFRRFFEWFRNREDIENEQRINHNSEYRDSQLESVRNALQLFMPSIGKIRVKRSPLCMVLEKDGHELKINQMSDGEKCFFSLVGDIARRLALANPGLENPLFGEGVIIIDELDLHLHPIQQSSVITNLPLVFPNCQFFITTHSVYMLNSLLSDPDSDYHMYFTRNNDGVVSIQKADEQILQQIYEDGVDLFFNLESYFDGK